MVPDCGNHINIHSKNDNSKNTNTNTSNNNTIY